MIEFKSGNILAEDAEALVNTVNTVGIAGRGVALRFREAFPENFKAYQAASKRREIQPGRMFVFETKRLTNPRYIINFPTKRHWRGRSRLSDIDSGLSALVQEIRERGIRSIAIPPLGAGLGGLDWADVRPRIERALSSLDTIRIVVFEPLPTGDPGTTPELQIPRGGDPPVMTPGRAALIGLVDRYQRGLLDPFVTLLEIHKLTYFMQESGEPLRLRFVPAPYGPYAENLRHVLRAVNGYFISGYGDIDERPDRRVVLIEGAAELGRGVLVSNSGTAQRFERVADLVEGFETPYGLELLATVHWVAKHDGAKTAEEAVPATYSWGSRKQSWPQRHIQLAWNVLEDKGWFS
jgi:O-acetyl-ADP-ribose deacetylase (regulator of RNase III)